ncbi:MAG: F0F1 ATP synthase subunit alpha, partial [Candidatus Dormibacteraceae bacterium]
LEADLFNAGQRPAISVGISVSRVGGDAQIRPMNKVAGQMKLELAQYRELAAFAQFASDLDQATRSQLDRGQRLTQVLKQGQYQPIHVGVQVCLIFAGTRGFLDKVALDQVEAWEAGFVRFLLSERRAFVDSLERDKRWDDEVTGLVEDAVRTWNRQFGVEGFQDHQSSYREKSAEVEAPAVAAVAAKAAKAAPKAASRRSRK